MSYSANGDSLVVVTGGMQNRVEVLHATTGLPRFPAIKPILKDGPCRAMAISSSGKLLVTAVNGKNALQVWSLETGKPLCDPLLHPGDIFGIYCVTFSPDEQFVLSGSKDRQVRIWNWREEKIAGPTFEHQDEVWSIAVLPDGEHIVSGGRDGLLMLWDASSGKPLMPALDCEHSIMNLSVVPDSAKLFITSSDRVTAATNKRLLKIDLADWISPPKHDLADMNRRAELVSGHTIQQNSARLIDSEHWQQELIEHQTRYPRYGLPTRLETVRSQTALAKSAMHRQAWLVALTHLRRVLRSLDQSEATANATDDANLRFDLQLDCVQAHLGLGQLDKAKARLVSMQSDLDAINDNAAAKAPRAELIGQLQQLCDSDLTGQTMPVLVRCLRDPQQYVHEVRKLHDTKQWEHVVAVVTTARELLRSHDVPKNAEVFFRLGFAASQLGDAAKSQEAYEISLRLNDDQPMAHNNLAYKLMDLQHWGDAINHLRRAAELEPTSLTRQTRLGETLLEIGLFDAAVEHFKVAYKVNAQLIDSLITLAKSRRRSNRNDDAVAIMQAALELVPERGDLHYLTSMMLSSASRPRLALKYAESAVQRDPDNVVYRSWLASMQLDNDYFEQAERTARETLKLDPDLLSLHVNLGRALLGLDRLDDAVESLQRALDIAKDKSGFPSLYLANVYRRQMKFDEALVAARTAHKMFADTKHTEETMQQIAQTLVESDRQPEPGEESAFKVAKIVFGDQQAVDAQLAIQAAEWCFAAKNYQRSADLYRQVLAENFDPNTSTRYNAICATVLACQTANEAGATDDAVSQSWMDQAILWMHQELDLQQSRLESGDLKMMSIGKAGLDRWLVDEDLTAIRGSENIEKWPPPQQAALREVWEKAARLRKVDDV